MSTYGSLIDAKPSLNMRVTPTRAGYYIIANADDAICIAPIRVWSYDATKPHLQTAC